MTIYQTEGIVLNKEDVGEADRRFLIFTKDYGKIGATARGIRKIKAKLAGHLENFNHSHLMLSISGNLRCNLISALTIGNFPGLKESDEKTIAAGRTADIINRFLPFHHKEPDFWQLLLSTYQRLDKAETAEAAGTFYSFKVEFLKLMGYFPPPDFAAIPAVARDAFLDNYIKELAQM